MPFLLRLTGVLQDTHATAGYKITASRGDRGTRLQIHYTLPAILSDARDRPEFGKNGHETVEFESGFHSAGPYNPQRPQD